jgi:hypothetical protein
MPDRNPRVLFLGRSRYLLPLPGWLSKKWDAIEEVIDYRVLGAAEAGGETRSERFRLRPPARPRALDGVLFYARLPFRIRRQIDEFHPEAIVAADPFIGATALIGRRLAGVTTPLIVEVHGDWRTFTRGYGSPARRFLSPITDRISDYVLRPQEGSQGSPRGSSREFVASPRPRRSRPTATSRPSWLSP